VYKRQAAARETLAARPLAPARLLLAEVLIATKRAGPALEELDHLAGRGQDQAEIAVLRGQALRDLGSPQESLSNAIRGRELDPTDPRAHRLLAELRLDAGQAGMALEPIRRACALSPQDGDLLLLEARIHLYLGDGNAARASLQRALAASRPPSPEAKSALLKDARERAMELSEREPLPSPSPSPR